jgi:hypothetical protein
LDTQVRAPRFLGGRHQHHLSRRGHTCAFIARGRATRTRGRAVRPSP